MISKMDVKMNLRIITKNHADDSKIGSPLKIDFKAKWTHESIPTAWVLTHRCQSVQAWTFFHIAFHNKCVPPIEFLNASRRMGKTIF